MHSRDRNVDPEWVIMYHWTVWLIKINTFNLGTPIWTVSRNKFLWIRTVTFLNTSRNDRTFDFCYFREGFYWDGIRKKSDIFVLVILYKWRFLTEFLWRTLKPSPIFFGVEGFFGRRSSKWETTGLTWSNMEQISSRYVL